MAKSKGSHPLEPSAATPGRLALPSRSPPTHQRALLQPDQPAARSLVAFFSGSPLTSAAPASSLDGPRGVGISVVPDLPLALSAARISYPVSAASTEMGLDAFAAACWALPVFFSLLAVRVAYVLCRSGLPPSRPYPAAVRCLIILGSGGHTAEMMNIVTNLQKDRFTPRYYVAALTDNMSLQKAQVYEQSLIEGDGEKIFENAHFMQIYRSREVGQPYITSIATTLLAILHAMWLIIRIRPQVIFCNGPGTCIPLCASAFLLKVLGLGWSSIFYIESIARVKKLSLSGLLLYKLRIADQFFVQWPQLQQKYPRVKYASRLM